MKNSRRRNRWIMGTVAGTAAIAVAIDHTRHRLPEPLAQETAAPTTEQGQSAVVIIEDDAEAPCGLGASPCALDSSPCSLDDSDDFPDDSPCSL
jgi:hypothetical protein